MRAAAIACLVASAGCSLITDSFVTNEFSGDPFPIAVDTQTGAIFVGMRSGITEDRTAVLDLLSPVTILDTGPGIAPSVASADVLVLGQRGPGGPLDLPRALLQGTSLLALHPCEDATCTVGTPGAIRAYDAIIGADALAGDAARLRLGDDQIFVLADIGGAETERTQACDAVFSEPYRGGGTLLIGGTERGFSGRRIALQACLGANPDPLLPQGMRGADALLVVSTSLGITILGESAYARYRESHPTAPDLASLPADTVQLPSGPVGGRRGSIDTLALVAASSSAPRAACRQVFASHLMLQRNCQDGDDCPCDSGETFCSVPAVVEVAPPTGLAVLVVPDADPTLQALRTELRPDQAEVDGILGTDAMRTLELDADYPHDRVLMRCTADTCSARPQLIDEVDRPQAFGCLGPTPPGPLF